MRIIRLSFGIYFLAMGIASKTWFAVFIGVVFSLLALFNIGCCGNQQCGIKHRINKKEAAEKPVIYEEVQLNKK